jgi:hypothetical protein
MNGEGGKSVARSTISLRTNGHVAGSAGTGMRAPAGVIGLHPSEVV